MNNKSIFSIINTLRFSLYLLLTVATAILVMFSYEVKNYSGDITNSDINLWRNFFLLTIISASLITLVLLSLKLQYEELLTKTISKKIERREPIQYLTATPHPEQIWMLLLFIVAVFLISVFLLKLLPF